MTDRIFISPTRVRVSRPGVNVFNPPAATPDYLAIDSDWTNLERPIEAGAVFGTINDEKLIVFTQTYPKAPAIAFVPCLGTQIMQFDLRYENFGQNVWFTGAYAVVEPHRAWIVPLYFLTNETATYKWLYFLWRTW